MAYWRNLYEKRCGDLRIANSPNTMSFENLAPVRSRSRGYQKDSIACIYPGIYVGAGCQFTRELAAKNDFTHVINCAMPEDGPAWFHKEHPGNYVMLGAIDSPNVNIMTWYPAFKEAMLRFMRDPLCKNIYVHCQCGINRSAYLALAFIIDHFDIDMFISSYNLIIQRPCVLTNRVFWDQVSAFAKSRASKYGGSG